jgi:hypothetical protein
MVHADGFGKSELASGREYSAHLNDRESNITVANVKVFGPRECLLFTQTCHVSLQVTSFEKARVYVEVLQIPRRSAL